MIRALRVVTVQRGIDPRRYALMAFGGAGGLHAAQIADELGIDTILCPRASGVLAALGLVVSPRRRDVQRSVLLSGDDLAADAIEHTSNELGERAREAMHEPDADLQVVYELRYRGQSFELPISGSTTANPDELRAAFEDEHEERYGYRDARPGARARHDPGDRHRPGVDVELAGDDDEPDVERSTREATLDGERIELEVLRGIPVGGHRARRPRGGRAARVDGADPAGLGRAQVDDTGTIHMTRSER